MSDKVNLEETIEDKIENILCTLKDLEEKEEILYYKIDEIEKNVCSILVVVDSLLEKANKLLIKNGRLNEL